MATVTTFHKVMAADFVRARTIKNTSKNELLFINRDWQQSYRFSPTFVTRKVGGTIDTFKIATDNWKSTFVLKNEDEQSGLLEMFSFDATVSEEKEPFVFVKNYAAEVILNEEKGSY